MRALDTNILVYASDVDSPDYPVALALLRDCAEGSLPWALPWPCIYEFLRVVTHPAIMQRPLTASQAWKNMQALLESPSLILLSQTERHADVLGSLLKSSNVSGNVIFDAHIAALLFEHGVREIVTADADFRRFEGLTVVDPFR